MKFLAFGRAILAMIGVSIEPQCNKWSLSNFVQIDWHLEEWRPKNLFWGIIEDGHGYEALPTTKKKQRKQYNTFYHSQVYDDGTELVQW